MNTKDSIKFSFSFTKRKDRNQLREIVDKVELITGVENIADSLEIIIAEMINGAVNTNLRRLYFEAKGFSYEDPDSYTAGLKSFSSNYGYLNLIHYNRTLELLELRVDIEIELDEGYMAIYVQNKMHMSKVEEESIRKKLKLIMENLADDMLDLYVHYGYEIGENALGLSMIIDLINKLGYDPANFRMYNKDGITMARLEIPLHPDYNPERMIRKSYWPWP